MQVKLNINTDLFYTAEALHELANYIENEVEIDEIKDTLKLQGDHYIADIWLDKEDEPDIHEHTTEELEYKGDKIVKVGNKYTTFAFNDDDCEDISEKEFYSLDKAQAWLDLVHGREVHDA